MKSVAAALPRKKKTENLFSGGKSGAISVSDDRSPRLFSIGKTNERYCGERTISSC